MTEQVVEETNFLIELDCLLDTRLCVLDKLVKIENIKDYIIKDYHIRETDKFPNVSFSKYTTEYNKRNKSTLVGAMPTYMQTFVLDFAKNVIETSINTPFKRKPVLTVNIYPYVFTEEEEVLLIKSLCIITGKICDIKLVSMTHEQITPRFVKDNISMMCMYRYDEWIELHSKNENFKKVTCPEVTLIGPMISFKEEYNPMTATGENPFEAIEKYMSPLVNVLLFPIKMFCFKINSPA